MNLPSEFHHDSIATLEWMNEPPLWVGDGRFLEVPGQFWGVAAIELLAAPALTIGTGRDRAAPEHRQLAERIIRGLRSWENLGSLELRYVWGSQGGGEHLRVLLIGRTVGQQIDSARAWARQMLQNVTALFPSGYEFGPIRAPLPHDITAWAEIERTEETRQPGPFVPPGTAGYYYLLHPLGGSGSGWPSLPRALSSLEQPGFLSIALVPTSMTDLERAAVDHIGSLAGYFAAPQQTYDFFGNQITNPADAGAQAVQLAWQRFPERSGLLARIGVATHPSELHRIASLVGSIITEGSDQSANPTPNKFKIVAGLGDFEAWQTATLGLVFPRQRHPVWSLPDSQAPIAVERMPYFFSEEEAGGLLMLPVPDEQGVSGIPLARRVAAHREAVINEQTAEAGVRLGSALHHGKLGSSVALPLSAINRHALIVGAPGSGKTTTVLSLLVQLWRDHQIPFLAIESVKAEYRSLIGTPGLQDLRVITLGNESVLPLRLNPLEPPPSVRCELHISAVMASLKMALPLFPPQPQILTKALARTYDRAGWDDDTTIADGIAPPTLRDLLTNYRDVFAGIGYEGEAKNIGLAFQTRLESLLQGSRGKLLDTVQSSDFDVLLRKPVVIEMNDIQDADEKAVLAAFILDRIRAGAKIRGSTSGQLKHVTVIEEAHRLLAKANVGSGDATSGDQARADSVRAFCEAIAELRSLGEGFILSSHSPSALADAAVANTGTRILHRMESSADRKLMLDDLDASETIRETAARLRKGEAVARWPERDEVEVLQVVPVSNIDSGRYISDETVAEHMQEYRREVGRILPYQLCAAEICMNGCQSKIRRSGAELADDLGKQAHELWAGANSAGRDAVEPIAGLLARRSGNDLQRAYCGAVHLSIQGDALRLRPGVDDRPTLTEVMRRVVRDGQ